MITNSNSFNKITYETIIQAFQFKLNLILTCKIFKNFHRKYKLNLIFNHLHTSTKDFKHFLKHLDLSFEHLI
jgi:hypothetical protein